MKFVIYEISYFFGSFWGWRFVDSRGNPGLGEASSSFLTEEDARVNLTETLEVFGADPSTVTIEVEEPEPEPEPEPEGEPGGE